MLVVVIYNTRQFAQKLDWDNDVYAASIALIPSDENEQPLNDARNSPWRVSNGSIQSSKSLILPHHMQQIGAGLARAFPARHSIWCTHEGYSRKPNEADFRFVNPKGLIYVKVPKSASTTTSSVIHRISRNNGDCMFKNAHVQGAGYFFGNRNRNASFMLASVRDPAARAVSRVFFSAVSKLGFEPTDENILERLNYTSDQFGSVSFGQGGFQLNYMTMDPIPPWSAFDWNNATAVQNPEQVVQNVQKIIEQYDFIVVVERMDESLVVLQLVLGVDAGDLLTIDSKTQGYVMGQTGCFKLAKSHVSPRVKEYLSSDEWYAQNYGDYLLHAAANASLDMTIETLGRTRVEEAVKEFRRMKAMANEQCAARAVFPCSNEGVDQRNLTNCYHDDQGCGYQCIDDLLKNERMRHSAEH